MDLPNCVIPIHMQKRDRLESFGSGVLLLMLDHRVLVSAAHVLLDDPLWLPGKPKFVPLDTAGRVFATSPNLDAAIRDRADLAYAILSQSAAEALEGLGCEFLSIDQTTFGKAFPKPERWTFTGYPWRKSNNRVVGQIANTRMDVTESAIPTENLADFGFDAQLHIAMRYPRKKMRHKGRRVTGALPHGMSGGAIWHVPVEGVPVLAAIATNYDDGKKLMRGTRINPLLFRIRDELRADKKELAPVTSASIPQVPMAPLPVRPGRISRFIKTTFVRIWKYLVGLSVVASLLAFIPRPTVSAGDPVDPDNIFSSPFVVSNNGYIPLSDVSVFLGIGQIYNGGPGNPNLYNETPTVTAAIPRLTGSQWQHLYLSLDRSLTVSIDQCIPVKRPAHVDFANVAVIVVYRPWFFPFHRERVFGFKTYKQSNGQLRWYSQSGD